MAVLALTRLGAQYVSAHGCSLSAAFKAVGVPSSTYYFLRGLRNDYQRPFLRGLTAFETEAVSRSAKLLGFLGDAARTADAKKWCLNAIETRPAPFRGQELFKASSTFIRRLLKACGLSRRTGRTSAISIADAEKRSKMYWSELASFYDKNPTIRKEFVVVFDETAMKFEAKAKDRVIGERGRPSPAKRQRYDTRHQTFVPVFTADGEILLLVWLVPGATAKASAENVISRRSVQWPTLVLVTPKGYMTQETFIPFMTEIARQITEKRHRMGLHKDDAPALVVHDGAPSHRWTRESLLDLTNKSIYCLLSPANTTAQTQVQDVAFFGPFKAIMRMLRRTYEGTGRLGRHDTEVDLALHALTNTEVASKVHIQKAFQAAGVFPAPADPAAHWTEYVRRRDSGDEDEEMMRWVRELADMPESRVALAVGSCQNLALETVVISNRLQLGYSAVLADARVGETPAELATRVLETAAAQEPELVASTGPRKLPRDFAPVFAAMERMGTLKPKHFELCRAQVRAEADLAAALARPAQVAGELDMNHFPPKGSGAFLVNGQQSWDALQESDQRFFDFQAQMAVEGDRRTAAASGGSGRATRKYVCPAEVRRLLDDLGLTKAGTNYAPRVQRLMQAVVMVEDAEAAPFEGNKNSKDECTQYLLEHSDVWDEVRQAQSHSDAMQSDSDDDGVEWDEDAWIQLYATTYALGRPAELEAYHLRIMIKRFIEVDDYADHNLYRMPVEELRWLLAQHPGLIAFSDDESGGEDSDDSVPGEEGQVPNSRKRRRPSG